jgi:hypothetical protein
MWLQNDKISSKCNWLSIKHQVSLNGHPQPFYLLEKFRSKVKLKIEKLKKK